MKVECGGGQNAIFLSVQYLNFSPPKVIRKPTFGTTSSAFKLTSSTKMLQRYWSRMRQKSLYTIYDHTLHDTILVLRNRYLMEKSGKRYFFLVAFFVQYAFIRLQMARHDHSRELVTGHNAHHGTRYTHTSEYK